VVGGRAYVADADDLSGNSSLRIVDVSDPAAPAELGALAIPDHMGDVEVVGGLAYVAAFSSGFRIIDVSDPAAPVERGALGTFESTVGEIDVVGGLAYVTESTPSFLRIIDVSDPAAPVELGALETAGFAMDVEVVDGLAYVADISLRVIDVSDPAAPVERGALGPANARARLEPLLDELP
jgi:hypothetical protein